MTASNQPPVSANSMDANYSLRHRMYGSLRRWHCRSTHHGFALDALPLVQTKPGHRLTSILLRHYDRYLLGAIDPDLRIRDYQNHVIHVTQGYWGGAPRVAHRWYDRMLDHLRQENFGDAAHAAGVLSHYFVDPLQPLHTMQCDRGRIIHRPFEWSVAKSYDTIVRTWIEKKLRVVVQLSDGPGWLGEAILHNARYANGQYNRLVQQYNLDAASIYPPHGLNNSLRESLAGLFGLAITGWARVLERAASDAETLRRSKLPDLYLVPSFLSSIIRIPMQKWLCRIETKMDQEEIDQLINEYRVRGRLKRHLPDEVDIMHRVAQVYADEMRYRKARYEKALDPTSETGGVMAESPAQCDRSCDQRAA